MRWFVLRPLRALLTGSGLGRLLSRWLGARAPGPAGGPPLREYNQQQASD